MVKIFLEDLIVSVLPSGIDTTHPSPMARLFSDWPEQLLQLLLVLPEKKVMSYLWAPNFPLQGHSPSGALANLRNSWQRYQRVLMNTCFQ